MSLINMQEIRLIIVKILTSKTLAEKTLQKIETKFTKYIKNYTKETSNFTKFLCMGHCAKH